MRVLVTGGSGFIGTNAIAHLLATGHEPVSLDIVPPVLAEHGPYYRRIDLRDRPAAVRAIAEARPDAVLHLGARTDFGGTSATVDYAANVEGVANVIEGIDAAGSVRHAVFASTRLVQAIDYRPEHMHDYRPPNAYGESKVMGEQLVMRAGPREAGWTIVRPTSVWGPWFNEPNRPFFRLIARGLYVHPGRNNPPKQYSYVENGVAQLMAILDAPREVVHGQTFPLADYEPLRLRDWANAVQRATGARPIRAVPSVLLTAAATAGSALRPLWPGVPLTRYRWDNLRTPVEFDLSPLRAILPELPFTADEGVGRTVDWMRSQGDI